jgi:membrane fusion protein (multidrug efflux system)
MKTESTTESQTISREPKAANSAHGHTTPHRPEKAKSRGSHFVKTLVLGTALVAGVAWGFKLVRHSFLYQQTDDAYVVGHMHQVSPQIEGTVAEVLVKENQAVKAGDVLLRLDSTEQGIHVEKARATLEHSRAMQLQAAAVLEEAKSQLVHVNAEVAQAEAHLNQTTAMLHVSQADLGRNSRLYNADVRAIAKADVDVTKGKYDADQAAVSAAEASLTAAKASVDTAKAAIASAEAQVAAAKSTVAINEAELHDAERLLSYTVIKAPVSGHIGNKSVELGNRVQPGQVLMALAEPDFWVVANFKETQLTNVREGQHAELEIDAFPGHQFEARVDSVAPASGAQFALLPPDNATGNFTKVVQRVPVKLVFDPESIRGYEDRLRPGLSTVVNISVR